MFYIGVLCLCCIVVNVVATLSLPMTASQTALQISMLQLVLPVSSLSSPVLSVHSGVCGSAFGLSPEAVGRERRGQRASDSM